MELDNHINYIEFKAHDLEKIKAFLQGFLAGLLQIMAQPILPFLTVELQGVLSIPISPL